MYKYKFFEIIISLDAMRHPLICLMRKVFHFSSLWQKIH